MARRLVQGGLMRLGHLATRMVVTIGLLLLAACHHMEPIQNFSNQPITGGASKLPLSEIANQIKVAGATYGWIFTDTAPGKMTGVIQQKQTATVEITYSQTSYSITLLSSTQLRQTGDEIGPRYNIWARNLNAAIARQLAAAGAAHSG
jgi:hypothetical protein